MFKKILIILILPMLLFLSACSAFVGEDGVLIKEITAKANEDGSTLITITFADDTPEVTFTIPKGEQGEEGLAGVGISSIEEKDNKLIVTLTDGKVNEIPLNLEDILNISSTYNLEDNETVITIETTKGSYEFKLKDALGIKDVISSVDGATGNTIVVIEMTDGSTKELTIPKGDKGEDGRGILSILNSETATSYILTVTYTDETYEEFAFTKPISTKWYSGSGAPNNLSMGILPNDGDFYFDKANFRFYQYQGSPYYTWNLVADLGLSGDTCQIIFNAVANGGEIISGSNTITCDYGSYVSLASIPLAYKEGYTFVGWYTTQDGNNNVNAQKFTDLTPVLGNLTLYACFELNA